jgi:hypothetical protein
MTKIRLPHETTLPLRHRQRGTVTMLVDPPPARKVAPIKLAPRLIPPPDPDPYPAIVGPVYDFATRILQKNRNGALVDEYDEHPMEGSPILDGHLIRRNREIMLGLRGQTALRYGGGTVENQYPLQTDAQSARTNTTLILESEPDRRTSLAAVAPGSSVWLPPADVADQRESIERLTLERTEEGTAGTEGFRGDGLERWARGLDEVERREWGTTTAVRIGREGRAVFRVPEAPAYLSVASEWAYEPWRSTSDYIFTEGLLPTSDEVAPPALGVNRRSAVRVELLAAPQVHRVVFRWVAAYMLLAGWWLTILYFPTVRAMSLRSPFWPAFWTPAGRVSGNGFVDHDYSQRIARTQTYAEAIRSDTRPGGLFYFLGRFGGRFGVYYRDLDRHALCAEWRQTWPDGTRRELRVFRRNRIARPNDLLHVAGLYVPGEITAYTGPEFEPGHPLFAHEISDGF